MDETTQTEFEEFTIIGDEDIEQYMNILDWEEDWDIGYLDDNKYNYQHEDYYV